MQSEFSGMRELRLSYACDKNDVFIHHIHTVVANYYVWYTYEYVHGTKHFTVQSDSKQQ